METLVLRKTLISTTAILILFALSVSAIFAQGRPVETQRTPQEDTAEAQILPLQMQENAPVETQQRPLQNRQLNQPNRADIQQAVQQRRTQAIQEAQTRKTLFQQRAQEIADANKSAALERIGDALSTVNTNVTNAWANVLTRLTQIVDRVAEKVVLAEMNGFDVAEANLALQSAYEAIEAAMAAVEEQASKEYIPEIDEEMTLRSDVQPTVQELRQDLRATLSQVLSARDAARQAARALASIETQQSQPDFELDLGDEIVPQ